MQKTLITYLSRTGRTKYFGHNIEKYLADKGIEAKAMSIHDVPPNTLDEYETVFLGCWTHGFFLFLQHPDQEWVKWAKRLPSLSNKKVVLFTTYKLATGSMFKNMRKHIDVSDKNELIKLKSKSEDLTETNKIILDTIL